jgi:hypothetical protein
MKNKTSLLILPFILLLSNCTNNSKIKYKVLTKEILQEATNIYVDSMKTILIIDIANHERTLSIQNCIFIYDNSLNLAALMEFEGRVDSISSTQLWAYNIVENFEEKISKNININKFLYKILIRKITYSQIGSMMRKSNKLVGNLKVTPNLKEVIIYSKRSLNETEGIGWDINSNAFSLNDTIIYPIYKLNIEHRNKITVFNINGKNINADEMVIDKNRSCLLGFYDDIWKGILSRNQFSKH